MVASEQSNSENKKYPYSDFNKTGMDFPDQICLAALFEEQCRITPDHPAVIFNGQSLTYSQLNVKANQIAHLLRKNKIGADDLVGICADRSIELAAGIIGIIKSGAAYVPFDPSYPSGRIEYMIESSGIKAVLAAGEFQNIFESRDVLIFSLDNNLKQFNTEPVSDPPSINKAEHLAYVLFTSGSTGKPKGVAMVQRALINLLHWQKAKTRLYMPARTLQFAPISFDVSFQELFTVWTTGGTLYLIEDDQRLNAFHLLNFIREEKIERLFLPFIALQHLAEVADENKIFPDSLKDVITAGEQLRITRHIRNFFKSIPGCILHNHYGPTESHVVTSYTLPDNPDLWDALPPIGTPVSNTMIYLLDEKMNPVKAGTEGELYIGGMALARGYIHQPELVAERFLNNPFDKGKIYRTGDLAKYLPDGNIEYLGRTDGQVKVRGYRIELGEIEVVIGNHPLVKQCAATVREDVPGDKRLAAYVVPVNKSDFSQVDLRNYLKAKLPDYMMPSAFVIIENLPRTPSGKIDKRSLPKPDSSRPEMDSLFVEPRTANEKMIAGLWCNLLQLDRVGIQDNFFDLGGNSLLALQMIAKLKSQHGIDLPVVKLYQHPTITGIIRSISAAESNISFFERAQARANDEQKFNKDKQSIEDGIAIIGMAGRFPGAENIDQLWKILIEGKETIRFFKKDELDRSIDPEVADDPYYVAARGILEDAEMFDAGFFGINPKVAELMDPQQRIFLETAFHALEHSGYCAENFPGMIGVYAGMGNNTYFINNVMHRRDLIDRVGSFQVMTANEKDYLATRVAHDLNLTGPALSIHTACSTSLVAIATACESLSNGKCDMALAGAISITSPVRSGHIYNEGGMFSADGHTRPFDAIASGTVFSDGCGIVMLKRYKDAVRDGDTVHAVIRGVALNNDGSAKASFTAPSVEGQAMAVAMAIANAGITPESISYIEAHGTATPLGDPIEIEALTLAFGNTGKKQFCSVGSVKSNFGHLTAAAGVAGLIKTVLALKNKTIPPTLFFQNPNPAISFADSPFFVNNSALEWQIKNFPRRAGISSFGVGGTNVHVVVEEAPEPVPSGIARSKHLFLFSAKNESSLETSFRNAALFMQSNPQINPADAAYTLQTGRKQFNYRKFVVSEKNELSALTPKNSASRFLASGSPDIVFMFPGQGAQYVNMGQNLYRDEIVFKHAVDLCAEQFEKHIGKDIRKILFPEAGKEAASEKLLKETFITQPALFTIGIALSKLWESWGIKPSALIGHSIGEYAAACIAGVMSLEDACFLVAHRGSMMQALPHGSMLSVRMAAEQTEKRLDGNCSIAAINGPQLCVVSGETTAIEKLQKQLEQENIICKLLVTSHAFHSPMMEPMMKPFLEKVQSISLNKPSVPIYSTVTAKLLSDAEATNPSYWSGQIRSAVRFADGIQTIWNEHPKAFLLELGSRNTASTLAKQQAKDLKNQIAVSSMGDTSENDAEWSSILFALGQLWLSGAEINWNNFYALEKRKRIPLPLYPFEKKRYWVDAAPAGRQSAVLNQQPTNLIEHTDVPEIINAPQAQYILTDKNQNINMNRLIAELKEMLEEASGIELKNAREEISFLEIGLDSLFLTQSALSISKKFGVKVTFRQLNDDLSTLKALAEYLDKNLPAEAFTPPAQAAVTPAPLQSPSASAIPGGTAPSGGNQMTMFMMQQMQMMQLMLQQMQQSQQQVAPVVQQHIEKSIEIKAHTSAKDISENEKADLAKPFGAIARIEKASGDMMSESQNNWLKNFILKYNSKTKKSKDYCQQYRAVLADPRVVTGFKPPLKEIIYQLVVNKSKGCHLWDIDGNKYTDVLNGFGSNFFGYGSEILLPVWRKQLEEGVELGPQTPFAGECAQLICELTGYERAGFCNTGSEAVLGAMRIARTVTGRNLIVCFNGSYHGINDEVIVRGTKKLKSFPAAAGIPPESVQNMLVLDYGTEESLQIIRERIDEIAAVMIEPVQSRRADFYPKEFIHSVRKITGENNAMLIFDEVITGFRLRLGGAQEFYDVKADLSTYGKVIGGNMPIGIIAGRKKFMDALDGGFWQFGDDSVPEAGVTYFAGTFVRHPLAMAAMKETLLYLKKEGAPLYDRLNGMTKRLVDEVNAHSSQLDLPFKLVSFGSLFKAKWDPEPVFTELLFALMRFKGVHIMDGFPCFLTLAFTASDVDFVIRIYKESLSELVQTGFIEKTSVSSPHKDTADAKSNGQSQNTKTPPVPGAKLGKDEHGKPGWFVPDPARPGKYLLVKI